ncbi:MAG: glycosyltransferase, partial [Brasilonema sp.]
MISVITPVYNGKGFIESCIKVVIDQNCPNVEHIIVDAGSTDGTVEIIKQYAE